MGFNLFVAYDLDQPGQNYKAVRDKIESLGQWYQLQFSFFYLHTNLSAEQAHAAISAVMDSNDRLTVVDANYAIITPIPQPDLIAINQVWSERIAA